MEVTEVRIKLAGGEEDKLLAYCSVTLDDAFVVRGLKIVRGDKGLFVSMPCRKVTDYCLSCHCKNPLAQRFCGGCGLRLDEERAFAGGKPRVRLYEDVAHPVRASVRDVLVRAVMLAYEEEVELSRQPGYVRDGAEAPSVQETG